MDSLAQHIEALIFASDRPISLTEIKAALEAAFETAFEEADILRGVAFLKERYADPSFSFEVIEIAEGYQFLTKGAFHKAVGAHLKLTIKKRLSQAALETLSIIAYKQPVSKNVLEQIRGVSCDYALQKLLEKELVIIAGRAETPGRPLVYATSERFMDYFGIKSLRDLPKPKDFKEADTSIGQPDSIVVE